MMPAPTYARTASATDSTWRMRSRLRSRPDRQWISTPVLEISSSSGLPSGSRALNSASSVVAPRHASKRRLRSALLGISPRGSRCISACALLPDTGRSTMLQSLSPCPSVSARMSSALALIALRTTPLAEIPPCAKPHRSTDAPPSPSVHWRSLRGNAARGMAPLRVSRPPGGSLRSRSSSSVTAPGDSTPCVRSSSGNFSPRLANAQVPWCVLSNHDMILSSSSLLCSWRVPSLLSSLRVRLT